MSERSPLTTRPCQPRGARPARTGGHAEPGRSRLLLTGVMFACAFAVIGVRVLDVALLGGTSDRRAVHRDPGTPHAARRADIVDRKGNILATTLPAPSLYANPQEISDPQRAAVRLARIIPEISQQRAATRMAMDRKFIWLKRGLTPRQQARINRLGIPGLHFRTEEKRFYPQSELTAHLVGMTDTDSKGIAGVERSFQDVLAESHRPLRLSLDLRIQHILTEELTRAMTAFQGTGAAGIVMDAQTGELIAMNSLPSFDPNAPGRANVTDRFNRATHGVYEMGSVFKIFTMAGALDRNAVALNDQFDVSEPIYTHGFTIRDFKPKDGKLTVPEIFMHSSNIGTVHIAQETGTELQREVLSDLGLTRTVNLELPEVGSPLVPSPWRPINTMTISYGHGLAVTPVQLTAAVAATVNGGRLPTPTLLEQNDNHRAQGKQVLKRETSATMRRLMRLVVAHGTGQKADAKGYRVGGKTGTADKLRNGQYANDARIASFVGAFPMDDPQYVVFTMIDDPKGNTDTFGYATGGWIAAPIVRRVVERSASLLGIQPKTPMPTREKANHPLLVEARAAGEGGGVAAN